MAPGGHPRHILHHEVAGSKLGNEAEEVKDENVALVIDEAFANEREALARWAAEDTVDLPIPLSHSASVPQHAAFGGLTYIGQRYGRHVGADHLREGVVKLMGGGMDRVILDGSGDVEARLLETEREPAMPLNTSTATGR